MAKPNDKKIYEIIDTRLPEVINEYLDAKRAKEDAEKKMNKCLEEIESYTDIDKASDFTGKVIVRSGNVDVELEYKTNTSIDKEKAFARCNELGIDPLLLFNASLSYSKPKFDKLTDEEKKLVTDVSTTSRAKTGIKFN